MGPDRDTRQAGHYRPYRVKGRSMQPEPAMRSMGFPGPPLAGDDPFQRRSLIPTSRRHCRRAVTAPWRLFRRRPEVLAELACAWNAARPSRSAKHRDLLGDPAAAVVGVDRRVIDAGRLMLAVAFAVPNRMSQIGRPARNCDRGCGAHPAPPARGEAGGSARSDERSRSPTLPKLTSTLTSTSSRPGGRSSRIGI